MTIDDEKRILAEILAHSKDFIYLNDRSKLRQFPEKESVSRCWHPFPPIDLSNTAGFQNEVPVILINDFTNFCLIDKISELTGTFKKEGYNAIVLSETSLGVLFGFEYISPYHYKGENYEFSFHIRNVIRVLDPDLVFILANADSPVIDFINILKEDIQPDITFNLMHRIGSNTKPLPSNADITASIFADERNEKNCKGLLSITDVDGIFKFIISNLGKKESMSHYKYDFKWKN